MRLITLNFYGGPQDGTHEQVKSNTLVAGECVARRFPLRRPKNKVHLYQSQTPWKTAEKQVKLHYLGVRKA